MLGKLALFAVMIGTNVAAVERAHAGRIENYFFKAEVRAGTLHIFPLNPNNQTAAPIQLAGAPLSWAEVAVPVCHEPYSPLSLQGAVGKPCPRSAVGSPVVVCLQLPEVASSGLRLDSPLPSSYVMGRCEDASAQQRGRPFLAGVPAAPRAEPDPAAICQNQILAVAKPFFLAGAQRQFPSARMEQIEQVSPPRKVPESDGIQGTFIAGVRFRYQPENGRAYEGVVLVNAQYLEGVGRECNASDPRF